MDAIKLNKNLEKLKKRIKKKPKVFTPDYPKSLAESLDKYLRMRTISIMRSACWVYDENNWPIPLYVDPKNIKIGYMNESIFVKVGMNDFKYFDMFAGMLSNEFGEHELKGSFIARVIWLLRYRQRKKLEYYDWLIVPILCRFCRVTNIDDFNIELFDTNFNYLKLKILNNLILADKKNLLDEIFDNFKRKNYASCICTMYPLLDHIIRKYFGTERFDKDISSINGVFKAAGFDLNEIDNLKPGAPTEKILNQLRAKKITLDDVNQLSKEQEYGLGFPGIALSSFLHFSSKYYDFYRKETANNNYLNRHAIIHGASDQYGTKVNAIKLLTYLYLTLELEPILKIIFKET